VVPVVFAESWMPNESIQTLDGCHGVHAQIHFRAFLFLVCSQSEDALLNTDVLGGSDADVMVSKTVIMFATRALDALNSHHRTHDSEATTT
jgi:hypothetical protein